MPAGEHVYAFPRLSDRDLLLFRLIGPGLGNLLFPWARARVFAARTGARMISPTWPQLKVGPLLRRERDSRTYAAMFRATADEISGLQRIALLLRRQHVRETSPEIYHLAGCIVEFEGIRHGFAGLEGYNRQLRDALRASLRPSVAATVQSLPKGLALHVQLGDVPQRPLRDSFNWRMDPLWFAKLVLKARADLGQSFDCFVFSDGTDAELQPLLTLPRVIRVKTGSAPADMLTLSSACALIGSGSTFSFWSHFFGEMPGVWHPQHLGCCYRTAPRVHMTDPNGNLPENSLELLGHAF